MAYSFVWAVVPIKTDMYQRHSFCLTLAHLLEWRLKYQYFFLGLLVIAYLPGEMHKNRQ